VHARPSDVDHGRIDAHARRLSNGIKALLVQDTDAVFAAACVNVQAGYFDDPPHLQGMSLPASAARGLAAAAPLRLPPSPRGVGGPFPIP